MNKLREKLKLLHRFVSADKNVQRLKYFVERSGHLDFVSGRFYQWFYSTTIFVFTVLVLRIFFWSAPFNFPEHSIVTVNKGDHLSEIAANLEAEHIISSSLWLQFFVIINGGERRVIAGDYYFPKRLSVISIANIIIKGEFGLTALKVSIPEGLNSTEMGEVISLILPQFNKAEFVREAKKNEGYLWPDTYFLMQNARSADVIAMMRENFARKTESLAGDIEKSGRPLDQIVTMASILEDEARTIEDKRIIAGILWKRIKLKMPLQVDSTLRYTTGKKSSELTKDDLRDDDPYNTYVNKGLPPTPISSPGLDSLRAAIAPTNTKYLYFLSGKDGVMHYAETFEQHKANREKYLN